MVARSGGKKNRAKRCSIRASARRGGAGRGARGPATMASGACAAIRRDNDMIRNFHVLYVGQIELDNIGLNGTPANDRRYSDERLREVFATTRDVAQHMDRLGYDVLWTAEHHFQREGYECLPNLIQLGLWLATQTE